MAAGQTEADRSNGQGRDKGREAKWETTVIQVRNGSNVGLPMNPRQAVQRWRQGSRQGFEPEQLE